MYVYKTTQSTIADLSVTDITNCCLYPPILKVNSMKPSQILHPPFCHQTVIYRKPSQSLHPPSCPQNLTPANHHTHYIHSPALTRLTPANHHNHFFHRPALTQLTEKTITQLNPPSCPHTVNSNKPSQLLHPLSCLTQLTLANHYIHRPVSQS